MVMLEHRIKSGGEFSAAYVAAYARLRNLYPYTRFVPRWTDQIAVVKADAVVILSILLKVCGQAVAK